MKRARGALLLDLVVGIGLLSLLSVGVVHLVWRSFEVLRAEALSAGAVAQTQGALASLARDIPSARQVRCTSEELTLTAANGATVTYANRADGLVKEESRRPQVEWPGVRGSFALARGNLVEIRLCAARSERAPELVCETAFWARAAGER